MKTLKRHGTGNRSGCQLPVAGYLLFLIVPFFLCAFVPSLFAMPLNPDAYKKLNGTAKLSAIENVFQSSPTLNKPSAQKFATITGTRKVLVLLVDFSDNTGTTASSSFDEKLFSVGTTATGSMRDYYKEVSYGQFDISGTVTVKYYRAPQVYNYYVNYQGGISQSSYPNNAQKLAEDMVNLANADIDFSQYDSNSDGFVDGLFIIHAGGGAEADGNMGKIWSHKWTTSAPVTVDGVKVLDYTMEPEDGNIGVFCHEYGHELGLPDLYDTTPAPTADSYGLGWWSLMAIGGWLNDGKTPSHMDAWSKIQMGWVTPTTPAANQLSASIPQAETNATIYKLWTNGAPVKEYFLVENRQQTKFDAYLPGGGLLIYHVDETVTTNNDNSSHYLVALMQADGLKNLEGYANKGDTGDSFPGSTLNKNFNGSTSPNSKNYASTETYVAVMNISDSGAAMTADLLVSSSDPYAPACTVSSLSSYTNTVSFTVAWSGADTGNPASGVKNYDVLYATIQPCSGECGGGGVGGWAYVPWFTGTTATQAVLTGKEGNMYRIICSATDNSGNVGSLLTSTEAVTTIDLTPPTATITPLSATQVTAAFTVSWSGTDTISGVKSYDVEYMDAAEGVWKNNWVQAGTLATTTSATFSGIDGHTYYFRVRATDNAGNVGSFTSAPTGDAQTIVAVDSTPPVILSNYVALVVSEGKTFADIFFITDEDTAGTIEYGTTSSLGLTTSMGNQYGKDQYIEIPIEMDTPYYYRLKVSDLSGNVTASQIKVFYMFSVQKGLSMIAFPITTEMWMVAEFLNDTNLKFARFDASNSKYHYYKENPSDSYLTPIVGKGFWIKHDTGGEIVLQDDYTYTTSTSIELSTGWNQIGNPYTSSVDISALKVTYQNETLSFSDANKKGWLANYLWSYESESMGYRLITPPGILTVIVAVDPGKGYWIYAAVPCSLDFTNPSSTTAKTMAKQNSAPQNSSNLIQFTLSSSSGSDTENYAGFAGENMKISDPPPALEVSGKPELYLKSTATGETNYALVAKKKNYGEEVFYLNATGNYGEQATLLWNFNASEFSSAVLVDGNGKEVSLLNEKQITLTLTKEPKQFLVKLKLKAPSVEANAENGGKPKILSAINFPNPDRVGNATFRYDVQGDVIRVLIEVYTLTGKKISSIEGELDGETKWLFGDTLPSGVYIYRITAFSPDGKDSVVRKMVVLK